MPGKGKTFFYSPFPASNHAKTNLADVQEVTFSHHRLDINEDNIKESYSAGVEGAGGMISASSGSGSAMISRRVGSPTLSSIYLAI